MEKTKIDTSPLSFFRFISAILIIFMHYGITIDLFPKVLTRGGSVIAFFYMLSGFVLFLTYRKMGGIDLRQYFIKRAMNILPFYYMAFFMFLLILIITNRFSFPGFFISLLGIQAWMPEYLHYINPPSWFVSGLLFFYCIFPMLFSWITKKTPNPEKLLAGSLLLWLSTILILNNLFRPDLFSGYFSRYSNFIECFPLSHFCTFYMGICGAYYLTERDIESHPSGTVKSISSTIFVIIMFVLSLTIHYQEDFGAFIINKFPYEASLYAPIILLMIINLSTKRNLLTRFFSLKVFVLLGAISYPLYILQAPIYHIYTKFFSRPMGLSQIEEFVFFVIPLIIIASVLTFLENKSIKRIYKKYYDAEAKQNSHENHSFSKSRWFLRKNT